MGQDNVEFRLVRIQDEAYGPDEVDVVEIYINGGALTDLWSRSSGEGGRWMRAADALGLAVASGPVTRLPAEN